MTRAMAENDLSSKQEKIITKFMQLRLEDIMKSKVMKNNNLIVQRF